MLNIIKADLYRVFKGKAIYTVFAVLIAFIIFQSIAGTGGVGINTTRPEGDTEAEILQNALEEMTAITKADGMTAPFIMAGAAGNMVYFLIPLVICFIGADFSSGAVKNALSRGIPRVTYYFAKLIPVAVCAVIIQLFNLILPIIVATIRHGFGGDFTMIWLGEVLTVYGVQTLMLLAITCVGMLIAFATKKTSAIIGVFIAFLMVPTLIFGILGMISTSFDFLMGYDIVSSIGFAAGFSALPSADIIRMFALCAVYILAGTAVGVTVCRKSDIK
jgi:ABC-type transport system involved in multi-copper enzyme maturation permease subunit